MAIIGVFEKWEGRKSEYTGFGQRKYTRVFQVSSSVATDDAATICLAPLLPRMFASYIVPNGVDLGALVRSKSAVQDTSNPYFWTVTVEYDTKAPDSSRHPGNANPSDLTGFGNSPFLRPTKITYDGITLQRSIRKSADGKAFRNSAGVPFDPPPTIDDSRPVLIIQKNLATFNQSLANQYRDAINSDIFFGNPLYTVKVAKIGSSLEYEDGTYYWDTRFEFHIRPEMWRLDLLDEGFDYKTAGGTVENILDAKGNAVSTPRCLDGSGGILAVNAPEVYLNFHVYNELPFAALGLP